MSHSRNPTARVGESLRRLQPLLAAHRPARSSQPRTRVTASALNAEFIASGKMTRLRSFSSPPGEAVTLIGKPSSQLRAMSSARPVMSTLIERKSDTGRDLKRRRVIQKTAPYVIAPYYFIFLLLNTSIGSDYIRILRPTYPAPEATASSSTRRFRRRNSAVFFALRRLSISHTGDENPVRRVVTSLALRPNAKHLSANGQLLQ